MTTVWWAILAAAAVSFSYKALGPALLGVRRLPEQAESVIALPAPSLLAGLVVVVALTGPAGRTSTEPCRRAWPWRPAHGSAAPRCRRRSWPGSWRRPCSDSSSAADRPPVPAAGGRGARPDGVSAAGRARVDRGTAHDEWPLPPPWRRRVHHQTTRVRGPREAPPPRRHVPRAMCTARRTVAVAAAHPANG